MIKSEEVKTAIEGLLKEVFTSKETLDILIDLLKNAITDKECKTALGEAVNYAVRELLVDEELLYQIKIFAFFLLRKFENDPEIKGMMDVLFAKGLGIGKRRKEDPELYKLLTKGNNKKADSVS